MMQLTASDQIDASKSPLNYEGKSWNVYLGKMHVHLFRAMDARDYHSIDYRKFELRGEQTIDATLNGPGIDQCMHPDHSRYRLAARPIRRVESDIDGKSGAVYD
jgi:hypothetical protein